MPWIWRHANYTQPYSLIVIYVRFFSLQLPMPTHRNTQSSIKIDGYNHGCEMICGAGLLLWFLSRRLCCHLYIYVLLTLWTFCLRSFLVTVSWVSVINTIDGTFFTNANHFHNEFRVMVEKIPQRTISTGLWDIKSSALSLHNSGFGVNFKSMPTVNGTTCADAKKKNKNQTKRLSWKEITRK